MMVALSGPLVLASWSRLLYLPATKSTNMFKAVALRFLKVSAGVALAQVGRVLGRYQTMLERTDK
jgi:hypothetical protein